VLGGSAITVGIVLLDSDGPWMLALGLGAVAVFLGSWFWFGWRQDAPGPGGAIFVIVAVAFAGTVTAVTPSAAVVQCFVFPLAWTCLRRIASSLVASVAIALAVGIGMYISDGSWEQSVSIEAFSLAFAIGLGLWISQIADQSNQRRVLLEELESAQEQLALLNRDSGITSERERLAREIHDTIAQDLTGIVLLAQRVSRELDAGETAAAGAQLVLLEESARTALAETRALVAASAPPSLEAGSIAGALERLGERFERETAIAVSVLAEVNEPVDRDLEVVLLRCAQEGLANVRKHSGASRVAVHLRWGPERSLQVSDNGAGFELGAATDGYGLRGMRDRLALAGGTLDVESGADGTTLLVTLPKGSS